VPSAESLKPERSSLRAPGDDASQAAAVLVAGRYRVEHALGKGGMASVWAVRDEAGGRRLAR
jgi:hypothetical protein